MTERQQQAIANSLSALVVIAIGLQLAWWSWHFAGPEPATAAHTGIDAPAQDLAAARRLFGGDGSSPLSTAEAPASDIRLKGVFAVDGETLSAAVVNLGGKDQAIKLNQDLPNGARLVEVHPDYIIVSRKGATERVALDLYRGAAPAGNRSAAGSTAGAGAATEGFRLNIATSARNNYSLSRQELNTVLQDPRQMEFLGRIAPAPNGGIRVDAAPANSLSNKLGLQAGDIITNVNGQPISSPGDLARLYQQFGTLAQVRVEVKRGGTPMMLTYAIRN